MRRAVHFPTTSAQEWTIHGVDDAVVLGQGSAEGDRTDGAKGPIFFNTGAEICEFYEEANELGLNAQATSLSPPFECRLRIDD